MVTSRFTAFVAFSAIVASLAFGSASSAASSAAACGPDTTPRKLIVFGTSLADTGRFHALSKLDFPAAPSWNYRFSNGPVYSERLAGLMGVEASDFHNFSVGGAHSGRLNNGSVHAGKALPGGLDQVDEFRALGLKAGCKDIAIFELGINDYYQVFLDNKTQLPNIPEPVLEAAALRVKENHRVALTGLIEAGERTIIVPTVGEIGARTGDPMIVPAGKRLGVLHNENLRQLVQELTARYPVQVILTDAFNQPDEALASGGVTVFAKPCKNDDACLKGGDAVQSSYFLWDEVHPTTAVHAIIAQKLYQDVPR